MICAAPGFGMGEQGHRDMTTLRKTSDQRAADGQVTDQPVSEIDSDILAIREMLAQEAEVPGPDVVRAGQADAPPAPPARRKAARGGAAAPHRSQLRDDPQGAAPQGGAPGRLARMGAALGGRLPAPLGRLAAVARARVRRRHLFWGGAVLLAILRPWLMLALVLVPILIVTGLFLALGQERFWQGVLRGLKRYARYRPARAEALRARLDRLAVRWDALLERLPEDWADALSFPDLDSLALRDERHDRAVSERLARLQRDAGAR